MKYILFFIAALFISCERNIDLELDDPEPKIVVDGYVESGLPPYIFLSQSSGYFDPVNAGTIVNNAITGAEVFLDDGTDTIRLSEITVNGFSISGVYTALDSVSLIPLMTGEPGKTYHLRIYTQDGRFAESVAKLHFPIACDSLWFRLNDGSDSLGLAFARLNDPDTPGNCYRWFAKRMNKDASFIPPLGSVFEDRFINGLEFDFAFGRGQIRNSEAVDDNNEETGLFKSGDTIIVRFTSVDRGVFEFWRDAETQLANSGSPFAVPSNIKSNIKGGTGLFATYSSVYDTIIAP